MGTNHEGVNFGRRLPPTGGQFSTLNNTQDTRFDPGAGGECVDLPIDAVIRFLLLCEEEGK